MAIGWMFKLVGRKSQVALTGMNLAEGNHYYLMKKVVLLTAYVSKEEASLKCQNTWEQEQPLMSSCRRVFTEQVRNSKKVVRARPVANGFIWKFHNATTGLQTFRCKSFRIIYTEQKIKFSIENFFSKFDQIRSFQFFMQWYINVAIMKWTPQSFDISSAFRQWNGVKIDVHLKLSSTIYEENIVCKLKRCI